MLTVSRCLRYATQLLGSWFSKVAIFIFCSMLVWSLNASADGLFTCAPSARVFSSSGSMSLVEDLKKLSRREFGLLKLSPAGEPVLTKGTEINVLVDQACLNDPERGARSLDWLKELRTKLNGDEQDPRSFVWALEREWPFGELQAAIEKEPCIQLASPNSAFQMMSLSNDPLVTKQEHLSFLHFDDALQDFLEPMMVHKKVTIAVIDSGVDFSHPDLRGNRWVNRGEIAANGIDDDRNGYIDDVNGYNFASDIGDPSPQGALPEAHHGTHVAGLAAARIDNGEGGSGINGVAHIMALNIFGATNSTRSALLENALRYAANQGADVINMSLGGREYSRTMRAALDYAISRGSFIVTEAGLSVAI